MLPVKTKISAVVLALAWAGSQAMGAEARNYRFDIAGQSLAQALRAYARVSGQQIIFTDELMRGSRPVSLKGEYTAEAALSQLLQGTGLAAKRAPTGAITIVRTDAAAMTDPAEQMRLAALDDESKAKSAHAPEASDADKDQVTVRDSREKRVPFSDRNVDLPRTIDDVQPYYVFDSETVAQSGAVNIEDFLKQRLTMNTSAMMASQSPSGSRGNISTINLRGLGTDKTLILVNGRRVSGVISSDAGKELQPDLNGIPLSAIDRIEVLPSSASGIYGGSAIGGVVNVILKRDYSGAEVRVSYDNSFDSASPRSNASFSYGMGLEGGRTNLFFTGQWSESRAMLVRDREDVFRRNLARIQRNSQPYLYEGGLYLGEQTNIQLADWWAGTTLLLDNGTVIPSINTHIPDGTAPGMPAAALYEGLARNGGVWNFELPVSTQGNTGLLRPIGVSPQIRSFNTTVRRQMLPWLEAFVDLSYSSNHSDSVSNPIYSIRVPGAAAINPFNVDVNVRVVDRTQVSNTSDAVTRTFTGGVLIKAPLDWTVQLDYTFSDNRFKTMSYTGLDAVALNADLLSGALNPFVDTASYPLNLAKYLYASGFDSSSSLKDLVVRGSGPIVTLPWGRVNLIAGLEHRQAHIPANQQDEIFPLTPASDNRLTLFGTDQATDSVYVETLIPLVAAGRHPLLQSLELQLAGRTERYTVNAGTTGTFRYLNPPRNNFVSYLGPVIDGQRVFAEAQYDSKNSTAGIKYQPIAGVTVRISQATAFLPPTPSQLVPDPVIKYNTDFIRSDPMNPGQGFRTMPVLQGGNPNLRPQNSSSLNAGVIWEPSGEKLKDLRLNLEFYRIEQFDTVMQLRAQAIVNNEALYPGRVTRDGNGRVTLVDTSLLNLFRNETSGWDLGVDYRLSTQRGAFDFRVAGSMIDTIQTQYSATAPSYESVGFHPQEDGAPKYKANAGVSWSYEGWNAGWAARFFSAYKMYGVAGGPNSMQQAGGGVYSTTYTDAQGSDEVPSQLYHDAFVNYDFGLRTGSRILDGASLQFGVRNVFDRAPPLDVITGGSMYASTYGDVRMRSYWLAARKNF